MKKFLFSAIVILFAVSVTNAQDVFKKGDLVFNAGVGVNNSLYSGNGYKSTIPVAISGEYGVAENLIGGDNGSIGVGGYLGYTGSKYDAGIADFSVKYSSIIVGARGTFHYQFVNKLDTYAGLMLGYDVVSSKVTGTLAGGYAASASGFSSSFFLGARYWFAPAVGAFAELGSGISNCTLGVAFRL
ncbi:MAG: hypothetical protein LBV47_04835 [Bacteroidales bacterium]|jgi:hypothetical protein|nr:hypothetical protein [Bacteroidales bacterium]